jgi:hypothetical protein
MRMTPPPPRFMTIDYIYGPLPQAAKSGARPPEIF